MKVACPGMGSGGVCSILGVVPEPLNPEKETVDPKYIEDVATPNIGHTVNSGASHVSVGKGDATPSDESNYVSTADGRCTLKVEMVAHRYSDTVDSERSS